MRWARDGEDSEDDNGNFEALGFKVDDDFDHVHNPDKTTLIVTTSGADTSIITCNAMTKYCLGWGLGLRA